MHVYSPPAASTHTGSSRRLKQAPTQVQPTCILYCRQGPSPTTPATCWKAGADLPATACHDAMSVLLLPAAPQAAAQHTRAGPQQDT